jgi:hypothetical protein
MKAGTCKTFEKTDCEGITVAICAPYFHALDDTVELERCHPIWQISQGTGHRDTPHAMQKM